MKQEKFENKETRQYLSSIQKELGEEVGGAIKFETGENYAQFIDKFFSWVNDKEEVERLRKEERTSEISRIIDEWLYQLDRQTVTDSPKATTKAVAGMAVKSYFDVVHHLYFDYKMIKHCRRVLGSEREFNPKIFTKTQINRILSDSDTEGHEQFPDLVTVAWNCICRRIEAVQIKKEDVDLSVPQVTIRGVKGSRDYTFSPEDPVEDALWNSIRRRYQKSENEYLFPSGEDHIAGSTFSVWFGRYGKSLFGEWVSIHDFARHTRITQLFSDTNMEPGRIQELARHRHLDTTMKYNHPEIIKRLEA